MNRSDIARALAKVIAYQNVGKTVEAREWFDILAAELGYADQLKVS